MALIATDAVPKNGRADSLDDAGLRPKGRRIVMLDGTELYAKIGQPVALPFGGKELNLRPGSDFVLSLIDEQATACIEKMYEYNEALKGMSRSISLEKFPEFTKRTEGIEKDSLLSADDKNKARFEVFQELSSDIGLEVFQQTKARAKDLQGFSADAKFKIVQLILLDAKEANGKWKKDKRKPNAAELNKVLSKKDFDYDYTRDEIDNLIHVYWQLNYSYGVEKKDVLSLRIPL